MASFIIEGGHRLKGSITPQGAKNEVLQILCAVLLTTEEVVVENVPDILDVRNLIDMLIRLAFLLFHTYWQKFCQSQLNLVYVYYCWIQ